SADLEQAPWTLAKFWDFLSHLIPAVIILGVAGTAQLIRIMRGNLLETLGQQFVTTARAKGLTERTVVTRYAVRVAINPLISVGLTIDPRRYPRSGPPEKEFQQFLERFPSVAEQFADARAVYVINVAKIEQDFLLALRQ
ncbi:ABC transporter permease subunit, partial [Lacticaseibacillus rhamnosus]